MERRPESTRGTTTASIETPVMALDLEGGRFIVNRESPTEIDQNFIRDGNKPHPDHRERRLYP